MLFMPNPSRAGWCRAHNHALDGAALLDRENATVMYMTFRSVFSGLHEDYLIRIFFDHDGDKTITFLAVWAIVRDALELLSPGLHEL